MRFSCAASIMFALSGSSFVAKANATEQPSTSSMPSEQPSTSSMPSCLMVTYEHTSLSATATGSDEHLEFPFTNLPLAATDVVMTVSLRGDLDGARKWYYAEGEYLTVGYPGRYGDKYSQCNTSFVDEDFVVAATFFNSVADDGQFDLDLRPFRSFMNPGSCSDSQNEAYIKLSYTYCELPSSTPTSEPSSISSEQPSAEPSSIPFEQPSAEPSSTPTAKPTNSQPSAEPSSNPSGQPSAEPSSNPSEQPSAEPSSTPTAIPTNSKPSEEPSSNPSEQPSAEPSSTPTAKPTNLQPSVEPSSNPSEQPSAEPSSTTTAKPTNSPSSSLMPTPIPTCPMLPFVHTSATSTATSTGEILQFPFTNLPLAATDVAISVSLRGDLDEGNEWYYVEGEFITIGYAARYGDKYSQCNTSFVDEDFEMSAASFNSVADDRQFDLQLRPFRSFIDPSECSPDAHEAYIKLSYMYCEPTLTPSEQASSMPSLMSMIPNASARPSSVTSHPTLTSSEQASSMPSLMSMIPDASARPSSVTSHPTLTSSEQASSMPSLTSMIPDASARPSSVPSHPTLTPSEQASSMPSCPITSVDRDSEDMGLMTVDCGPAFPPTFTCQEICFSFDSVKNTIGDAIITYKYRGDDSGLYDLYAGTKFFNEQTELPACVEQETVVTIPPVEFNSDDPVLYVVKGGVLNVKMVYVEDIEAGANECAAPKNMAYINLKYDFVDCG
jgi:hypothetical protein